MLNNELSVPAAPSVAWLQGTARTDWLFDGYGPPSEEAWSRLVWEQAYVDLGPSPMGNLGPYWHVPLRDDSGEIDTVHRLYPKLLKTKWLLIVRRACEEIAAKSPSNPAVAWQSIETAPTDGTPVLLWDGIDVAFGRFSWPDSIEEWWSLEGEDGAPGPEAIAEYQLYVDSIDVGWISETSTTIEYLHPTHWMPLPSPPQPERMELRELPNTDAAQEPTPGST